MIPKRKNARCPRAARVARWVGLSACGLLLALYISSIWFRAASSTGHGLWAGVYRGVLRIVSIGDPSPLPAWMAAAPLKIERDHGEFGWWPQFRQFGAPSTAYPQYYPDWPPKSALHPRDRATRWMLDLPLWIPLLGCGLPTGLLWIAEAFAVARGMKGRCTRCGYDRRGLAADAKCPECGAATNIQ